MRSLVAQPVQYLQESSANFTACVTLMLLPLTSAAWTDSSSSEATISAQRFAARPLAGSNGILRSRRRPAAAPLNVRNRSGLRPSSARVFLWTKELGMVDFESFLIAQGTFFEGWILFSTSSISADGTIHVGTAAGPRGLAGWKIDATKVNICHAPPGNPRNTQTINVPFVDAMADHLEHGDTIGFCMESE